ncbi:MAG: alpha/beta hydrolase [Phycisphaerales bacterium]|nr:alpha/beta hydrolase [Phycisphaerales bacterium]
MNKPVKRVLIAVPIVIVVLIVATGLWVRSLMMRPLYHPGMVRAGVDLRAPLDPPAQLSDPTIWRVEPDIDLHHFSHGEGAQVVFIHGGPGFPTRGVPAGLALLADHHQIHFYDQRGCGSSTRPFDRFDSHNFYKNMTALDQGLGMGAHIADIERIRRLLGQEKLIIVGHSFGGFIATMYAAEFPDHVAAMVLIAPADMIVIPPKDGDLFAIIRERLPDDMTREFDQFTSEYLGFRALFQRSEGELADMQREFARFYRIAVGGEADAVSTDDGVGGWVAWAIYLSLGRRHDYSDALSAIDAPVLILHGSDDLQPRAVCDRYASLLPQARVEVIEGAGHFMFNDQPERFAELVSAFLPGQ